MKLLVIFVSLGLAAGAALADDPKANPPSKLPTLHSEPLGTLTLGDSTLNFEGDRKAPDSLTIIEKPEPGSLGRRPKSSLGPQFFGLSIKKALE